METWEKTKNELMKELKKCKSSKDVGAFVHRVTVACIETLQQTKINNMEE